MFKCWLWALSLLLVICECGAQQSVTMRVAQADHPYMQALFTKLAERIECLHQKQVTYQYVDHLPSQQRAIQLLGDEHGIDLFWGVTSQQREQQGWAILIPIAKGLLGYRIALVRSDNPDILAQKNYISDFSSLRVGLSEDWPDANVFSRNGFTVDAFSKSSSHYDMLRKGRFDFLPEELTAFDPQSLPKGLIYDKHNVFYYPSAVYLFVAKGDKQRHQLLSSALRSLFSDGTIERLLHTHLVPNIDAAELATRNYIRLTNPLLPASAPLHISRYWYNNKQGTRQ